MKIVVLGAGGQVGQAVGEQATRLGIDAVLLPRDRLDITDAESLSSLLRTAAPSAVVNAAAYTRVDDAEIEGELAFRINRDGAANVARVCNRFGVPLVHLSTDYVFDGRKPAPYIESDAVSPLNVYGKAKERGEQMVLQLHDRAVILRTAWVFGPKGTNFLKTMLRLANTKDEWGVVADQVGTPTSTADLSIAILAAADQATRDRACSGLYHFAGGDVATWFSFANIILDARARRTGRRPTIHPLTTAQYPTPARRPLNSRLDSSLFEARFGIRAVPLAQRVDETIGTLLDPARLDAR
jgi:dTDP-4-dehydrorhamnose reductase